MLSRRWFILAVFGVGPLFAQKREEIRDARGRLMGTIAVRSDGVREARDPRYRLLGTYNPKTKETRDPRGRLLTKGDTLAALFPAPK